MEKNKLEKIKEALNTLRSNIIDEMFEIKTSINEATNKLSRMDFSHDKQMEEFSDLVVMILSNSELSNIEVKNNSRKMILKQIDHLLSILDLLEDLISANKEGTKTGVSKLVPDGFSLLSLIPTTKGMAQNVFWIILLILTTSIIILQFPTVKDTVIDGVVKVKNADKK